MNIDRIQQLIKRLESLDAGKQAAFNMSHYVYDGILDEPVYLSETPIETINECNTSACIAGHTCFEFQSIDVGTQGRLLSFANRAQLLLDLTDEEAKWLFHAEWLPPTRALCSVSIKEAIASLKHLAAGELLDSPVL